MKAYKRFITNNKQQASDNPQKRYTYDLQVYKDDFRFTLAIPPTGELVEDDFNGMYKRKALYQALEDEEEIFNWLEEVHQSILTENNN